MFRYREVYDDIKRNILTNHFRAGSKLPTQEDFSSRYNVNRLTLKKALQLLEDEGLVVSKQGSGTYVRQHDFASDHQVLPLDTAVGETHLHRDQKITSKVLYFNARLPSEQECQIFHIEANIPVYEFKRVRYLNGHHYSFEHTVIPTVIAPITIQILEGSLYNYLGTEKHIQLADAKRMVYAESANEETSEALKVDLGTAVLTIAQTSYDQHGKAFEMTKSRYLQKQTQFVLDVHRKIPYL